MQLTQPLLAPSEPMLDTASRTAAAQTVSLTTVDGFSLHADLFAVEQPLKVVLMAPAMGVHRRYYRAFARSLVAANIAVLTPDYRGMGESRPRSLRGFRARLHEWAELDVEAALAFLRTRYPGVPQVYVAHSVGGQLFGLLAASSVAQVERALFVGSQSGYWGHWPWPSRARMFAIWYALFPLLVSGLGYLPLGRLQGRGQDVPAGVAREWMGWARDPEYVMSYAKSKPHNAFAGFTGPIRSYVIGDDDFAPERSVRALLSFFRRAHSELRRVEPGALGRRAIGHFAPFSAELAPSLWPEFHAFITAKSALSQA